jgi:exonuclease III
MRLVTWNCNLSLSRKLNRIVDLKPDIAIIQECEREVSNLPADAHFLWVGNNSRKGLGVISFGTPVIADALYKPEWCYFLPLRLEGAKLKVLATWAFNHRAESRFGSEAIGRPLSVFAHLGNWIDESTLVAGDFNNSVVWDKPRKPTNFANVDACLRDLGLCSAYHAHTREAFGKESKGTLFHMKNANKPYHIDYVYVPRSVLVGHVTVGGFDDWRQESDHVPVVVDIDGV